MSRGSFGRTVARAAASGGSRSYRARPPVLWYFLMVVIVVGGVFLIGYSRNQRLHQASASVAPTKTDNWHAALAIDLCGTVQPNLPANTNLSTAGIRTFGDGVIDVDPGAVSNPSAFTGKHATLGTFISTYGHGFALSSTTLTMPAKASATAAAASSTTTPAASSTTTSAPSSTSTTTAAGSKAATSTTSAAHRAKTKAVASSAPGSAKASSTTTPAKTGTPARTTPAKTSAGSSTSLPATTTTLVPVAKGKSYVDGHSCPSTSKTPGTAHLVAKVWPSPTGKAQLITSNLGAIRLTDGEMITLAYVPSSATIPAPPSRSTLLSDLGTTSSGK
ncbi:MAG: hypothetical protein M0004_00415 [Actinomycetota bacterium]|nr:hypothetical protein [Actinomycetota bacterium]